jgi:hypothetical protein
MKLRVAFSNFAKSAQKTGKQNLWSAEVSIGYQIQFRKGRDLLLAGLLFSSPPESKQT